MGYTTEFEGSIAIEPPLSEEERDFLVRVSKTRRMARRNGPFFVGGSGDFGQGEDPDIEEYNMPPEGQPSLWCQWTPNEDGAALEWDGWDKFYKADRWMAYLVEQVLGSSPQAVAALPFLSEHVLNGTIEAQGEDPDDHWLLVVKDNEVSVVLLGSAAIGGWGEWGGA